MSNELPLKITNERHLNQAEAVAGKGISAEKKEKLAKAAQDFESLMTQMMIKSMTEHEGGLLGSEGEGADKLDVFFQQNLSQYISQSRGLGIAEKIYRSVTGEDLPKDLLQKRVPTKQAMALDPKSLTGPGKVEPSNSSLNRLEKYDRIIDKAAEQFGLDKNMIRSIILTESAANEKALSKANAKGLMQLIDSTAKDMGVRNVWNPAENIYGGSKYFSEMLGRYNGDVKLALAAYNAGPGNVDKYNGIPPFQETQQYVSRVLGYYEHFRSGENYARLD